jgi:hypothetical protein
MKSKISFILILAVAFALTGTFTACVVKKDNGKHKGWYKNPKNPHHPASTKGGASPASPAKGKGRK